MRRRLRVIVAIVVFPSLVAAQGASRATSAHRLALDDAIAEALEKNLELIATRGGVSVAEANALSAGLHPNPVLSLAGDHLDFLGTGFNEINGAGPPEYSLRVDYLFELGGKRARRIEVSEAERAIAEAQVRDAVRTLKLDVRQAFVELQLAEQNLALARENAGSLAEIVTLNDARVRGGEIAVVELLRSRIAALQSQQAVRAAELGVRTARRRLALAMGRAPDAEILEIQELGRPPAITATAADLRIRARRARPDLQALQLASARSQAEIRLQLAQGQIDFTVGAEVRRQDGLAGRGHSLGLFASLPLPLFDRNQGNVARVRIEKRQADTRMRRLDQTVSSEVDVAAAGYAAAEATLTAIESQMLSEARDVRSITDYAYRRGQATLIELLDAQRAFNETMQAWNDARADFAKSVFQLRAAVGEDAIP